MNKRGRHWMAVILSLALVWGLVGWSQAATPPPSKVPVLAPDPEVTTDVPVLEQAFSSAIAAADLAQSAQTARQWGEVVRQWAIAIQALQAVPDDSPQRVFAHRKAREYLQNQQIAQQRAAAAAAPAVFPTLGSAVLDEQLGLYLSYLATFGPPDVMIIGSSRALQGVDPQVLQQRLRDRGLEGIRVYTFAINGATAQVMSFVLRRLLTPEQLPELILWAGGSRAFNSGRVDRTFASILASPGYAALQAGERPAIDWEGPDAAAALPRRAPMPISDINGYGFLPVTDTYDPRLYYQRFPRVAGRYDVAYQSFELDGLQTLSLRAIVTFTQAQQIPLVFVNLPLTRDYLDETRQRYERQFQQYLQQEAALGGFTVVDLLQQWANQNQLFADPSHLNQQGAMQVASQLAATRTIPWQHLQTPAAAATAIGGLRGDRGSRL